jgi:hypothetical protein
MTNVSIALLSAAEFELARRFVGELSTHRTYEDWVDCRHGAFMGLSIGGEDAGVVTVRLEPFVRWCAQHGLTPSEAALDAFAAQSASHDARAVA